MRSTTLFATLLVAASAVVAPARAQSREGQLRLSRVIGDGMVMQRGMPVPVWGWASAGDSITVSFDGRRYGAKADGSGAWKVMLRPMQPGAVHEMDVARGGDRVRVRDIVVGDVWICSGQSNMEFALADAANGAQEVAAANDSLIRQFKVPVSYAERPEAELAGGQWERADAAHAGRFTAVGYFFARDIRATQHVPIGLINTSWGGSRIEPWMSARMLGYSDATLADVMRTEREYEAGAREKLRARLATLPAIDSSVANNVTLWADPALDDAAWATIPAPSAWEAAGYEGMDGIAWYRTAFDLSDAEARAGVTVGLGMIDDSDISYVNGVEVGRMMNGWNHARAYTVPASALRAGRNVIAVRVEDTGGNGGIMGTPDQLYVEVGGARRSLAGPWKFRVAAVSMNPDAQHINKVPTVIYNKMIHPLLPYAIKGVLWYQGESNADRYEDAAAYRPLFANMIRGWRRDWALGDVPFLWVQLPNYMAVDSVPPMRSAWATMRESQTAALALPRTGQAVTIDIGETENIHPKNKQDVGRRLALVARRVAYGESLISSGPTYRRHTARQGAIAVDFTNVGGGLVARGDSSGRVHGFTIAGADRHFVWADARIQNGQVVVSSDRVPSPVAARYAWGNNPLDANLYNRAGLPASPFRTDAW